MNMGAGTTGERMASHPSFFSPSSKTLAATYVSALASQVPTGAISVPLMLMESHAPSGPWPLRAMAETATDR